MNIQGMMKKAQAMQKKIQDVQAEFETRQIEGQSGGGLVRATINGKKQLVKIAIDDSLVVPAEKDVLEDLIVAAFNAAGDKADQELGAEMGKVTAGLGLPAGMKLPF